MDWEGIQAAIVDVERRRLGLPSRMEEAAARAKMEQAAAQSASGLETADVLRQKTRMDIETQPELRRLQGEAATARAEAAAAMAARQPQPTGPAALATMDPTQFAEYVKRQKAVADATRGPQSGGGSDSSAFWAPAMVNGKLVYVDKKSRQPIEGITPPPTAEMRNTEYQAQALEPAFESMKASLSTLKQTGAGVSAMVPGTDAYWAKNAFIDKTKALAGAITARMAGEGSRLSDEDRVAYSRASSIVSDLILLPGGIREAERRLNEAQELLSGIQARRNRSAAGFDVSGAAASPAPPQGATTTVRTPQEYAALPSGTIYFDPSGKRRRKP